MQRRGDRPGRARSCRRRSNRRHRGRHIGIRRSQHDVPQRHALRHLDPLTLLAALDCMIGHIAVHARVHMQPTRVARLQRPRVGVDERRQCLQGNDKPEHQQAVKAARHSRIGMLRKS